MQTMGEAAQAASTFAPFCQPHMPLHMLYCRLASRQYVPARLPDAQRRVIVARASMAVALDIAPHWTIVDCHGQGAAAYRVPAASAAPLYSPLQAAILDAIRHMRRWQYYADWRE